MFFPRHLLALAALVAPLSLPAQRPATPSNITTRQFGDLAAGPYNRLVIRNAMVIPGHGGPPAGPYDILIEGNTISQMVPFDPVAAERRGNAQRLTGDRVIEANGMYARMWRLQQDEARQAGEAAEAAVQGVPTQPAEPRIVHPDSEALPGRAATD